MQRLFSAFPSGWPGGALLLLRAAVGLAAIAQGARSLDADPAVDTWVVGVLAIAAGGLLVVGFLTPGAGAVVVLGCVAMALSWFPSISESVAPDRVTTVFIGIVAAAIVPLGPGAFSVDARLFGRREIVIHQDTRLPKRSTAGR